MGALGPSKLLRNGNSSLLSNHFLPMSLGNWFSWKQSHSTKPSLQLCPTFAWTSAKFNSRTDQPNVSANYSSSASTYSPSASSATWRLEHSTFASSSSWWTWLTTGEYDFHPNLFSTILFREFHGNISLQQRLPLRSRRLSQAHYPRL